MSFSFNFASSDDVLMDDAELDGVDATVGEGSSSTSAAVPQLQICPAHPQGNPPLSSSPSRVQSRRLDLDSMLDELPERISYSWVQVPLPSSSATSSSSQPQPQPQPLWLPRRDLFDARFQILHDDEDQQGSTKLTQGGGDDDREAEAEAAAESAAVVGTESDLIPGLYEGGLKTWESSVDLVGVLVGMAREEDHNGKIGSWRARPNAQTKKRRVVELGCGTALPTMYILRDLMLQSAPTDDPQPSSTTTTHLHLCDFNQRVLGLVTLPNLLLAYHFARQDAQQQQASSSSLSTAPENGELDLDEDFLSQFRHDLAARGVQLSFHAGPWEGLQLLVDEVKGQSQPQPQPRADLVLTSETTYRGDVVQSLVQTMRRLLASKGRDGEEEEGLALVATKDYYFGLGGGIVALQSALDEDDEARRRASTVSGTAARRALVETKRQSTAGVKRSVLAVSWPRQMV